MNFLHLFLNLKTAELYQYNKSNNQQSRNAHKYLKKRFTSLRDMLKTPKDSSWQIELEQSSYSGTKRSFLRATV